MVTCYDQTDRGYAYVVLIAAFLAQTLQHGVVFTVGVFYAIFVDIFPDNKGIIAVISSLNTAFFYAAGPLASFLTNRYGCRVVTIAGGLIGSSGLIFSMYANNIYTLYVTFGVMTGFGLGLSYLPSVTILGEYFDKKRSAAIGIATSGVGIGMFSHPPLIRYFVNLYGWRGALLLLAGVTLNLCVCGMIFKPFKQGKTIQKENIETSSSKDKTLKLQHLYSSKSSGLELERMVLNKEHCKQYDFDEDGCRKLSKHNPIHSSVQSIVSYLKVESQPDLSKAYQFEDTPTKNDSLNLFILKNIFYQLFNINNLCLCFSISIINVHLAAYAASFGIDADRSALLFTVVGLSNFIGRLSWGFTSQLHFTKDIVLFVSSFTLAGIFTCLCPTYTNYYWLLGFSATFGIFTGCFGTLVPGIMIEILDVEYLASAYGYNLVFCAVGTLTGAPMAGWLYEWTALYSSSIYLGGSTILLSSVIILPILFKTNNLCHCKNRGTNI